MPNSYHQIYLHFVFAVKYRQSLIKKEYKEDLHRYITGLVQNRKAKMLAVHCMPDHAHIFVGFHPSVNISDFVKEIKVESNEFLNRQPWLKHKFAWQNGYGVFSYSRSNIDNVIKYILNQEAHHKKKTFESEYQALLEMFGVEYDKKYLFEFFEEG